MERIKEVQITEDFKDQLKNMADREPNAYQEPQI